VRGLLGATMLRGGHGVRGPDDQRADRHPDTNELTGGVGRKDREDAGMPLVVNGGTEERRTPGRDELLRESSANPDQRLRVSRIGLLLGPDGRAHPAHDKTQEKDRADEAERAFQHVRQTFKHVAGPLRRAPDVLTIDSLVTSA